MGLILLPLTVFVFVCIQLVQSETCQTADNQEGECIVLSQCLPLNKLLKGGSPTPQTTQFLKNSHCGFAGKEPKVCCPIGSTTIDISKNDSSTQLLPALDLCEVGLMDKFPHNGATTLDLFSWTALLEYQKPDGSSNFHCGGALISKRYILTAAHCIKGRNIPKTWKLLKVRLGEHDTTTNPECDYSICNAAYLEVSVEKAIVHKDYSLDDINQKHDIALLRLQNDIQFNDFIGPICLPSQEKIIKRNRLAYITGWGIKESHSLYKDKRQGLMNLESIDRCNLKYGSQNITLSENKQICGLSIGINDFCKGDSGGILAIPFLDDFSITWRAIGILSFGPSTCENEKQLGVFTNVSYYKSWIIDNIKP